MKRKFVIPLILAVLIVLSCKNFFFPPSPDFSGTLEMTEHSVGARVPGRIAAVYFDEGQSVKKGELLAVLERYETAKKDYERTQKMHAAGGASDRELEQAELAFDDQQIVSPVDGVVVTRVRQLGEVLGAGSPAAVIGDNRKFWVRIYIPEGKINKVKMGQSAAIRFDGIQKKYSGHVTFIATQAEFTPRNVQTEEERVTQTFAVKVTLDEPDAGLHSGVAAEVHLEPV